MRSFSVIFRTLVGRGSYPSVEKQSVYSTAQANWAKFTLLVFDSNNGNLLIKCKQMSLFNLVGYLASIAYTLQTIHNDKNSLTGSTAF